MVERGLTVASGSGKLPMASSSAANLRSSQAKEASLQYYLYPLPLAKYEDVVACPNLFMDTLGKLHAAMGTKFMIPIIGGRNLNLHRLFVEVTSRGGIKTVLGERKWKEVTTSFRFPPSATNASYVLRKYYMSLLHHYEQVYYFKANAWTPVTTDDWHKIQPTPIATQVLDQPARATPIATQVLDQTVRTTPIAIQVLEQPVRTTPIATQVLDEPVLPSPEVPVKQQRLLSAEIQASPSKRQRISTAESSSGATPAPSVGFPVTGLIDGKFDNGYLVTITIGSEQLKGVIYQLPHNSACQLPHLEGLPQHQNVEANTSNSTTPALGVGRRRRRKKSEMKKRDPAHPKPNRSGYNFFFAEQHARLKPLHPGKDRDISRMIGDSWNKLTDSGKAVYQEKALKDKERYRTEMEQYRESLRRRLVISNAVPLQQLPAESDVNMVEVDENTENESGGSPHAPQNEQISGKNKNSNFADDKSADKDLNMEMSPRVETGAQLVVVETLADEPALELQKESANIEMEKKKEILLNNEEKESVHIEEKRSVYFEETVHKEVVTNLELVIIKDRTETGTVEIQKEGFVMNEDRMEIKPVPIKEKQPVGGDEIFEKDSIFYEERFEKEPLPSPTKESGVGNSKS